MNGRRNTTRKVLLLQLFTGLDNKLPLNHSVNNHVRKKHNLSFQIFHIQLPHSDMVCHMRQCGKTAVNLPVSCDKWLQTVGIRTITYHQPDVKFVLLQLTLIHSGHGRLRQQFREKPPETASKRFKMTRNTDNEKFKI